MQSIRAYTRNMDTCPFCKPDANTKTLLWLIKDENLLVHLACDMADRVAYLTPDSGAAQDALQAARAWQEAPSALNFAHHAAEEARNGLNLAECIAAQSAIFHTTGTATAAVVGVRRECSARAEQVAMCARQARAEAGDSPEQEEAWQRAHIRAATCTCTSRHPIGRDRISLLAH